MSKLLAQAHEVTVTSFAGGFRRGPCVQIDTDPSDENSDLNAVQLTRTQAEFVRDVLTKWLGR